MAGMYLRECLIENVGPITFLDVTLAVTDAGDPKPVILVGKNGTGKTIFLAYVLDALAELAKAKFGDVVVGQRLGHMPFLKLTSSSDSRSLSGTSISLLEFSDSQNRFCYVEKVGSVDPQEYSQKLRGRFSAVATWPKDEPFHKSTIGDEKLIERFFGIGTVCFFPSSRHERPHWLNVEAVIDVPVFSEHGRLAGFLAKPLAIESAADDNRRWLMDVLLDSLVEADPAIVQQLMPGQETPVQWMIRSNIADKLQLKRARANIETLLGSILEDENAKFVLNYRNAVHGRVAIRLGNGVIVPSLGHLSAGQSLLFNLFATIIRYAERSDILKSVQLNEIEGLVLVDEIDAHLHTDLQYEVLPRLIKLFPKVQFILTSHSPLFLLGMEREFGADGVQIIEMPTGLRIGTERFEEFQRSFEHYQRTSAFEDQLQEHFLASSKPLVLTEGETDITYIRTALELLGHMDILEQLEMDEIGRSDQRGSKGGGYTNLDAAKKFLMNNHEYFSRRVLLLYDCDTQVLAEDEGQLTVRSIPKNAQNTKVSKGIENLLPVELFEEKFYSQKEKPTGDGGVNLISEFRKVEFCEWVCKQRHNPADFVMFDSLLIPILRVFAGTTTNTEPITRVETT